MKLNFSNILEILFPKTDDERGLSMCTVDTFREKLHPKIATRDIWALCTFSDPAVSSAIHLNKFHAHPKAKALLAAVLESWITTLPQRNYILIPTPLSAQREKKRGYNQVTEVAQRACKQFPNVTLYRHILRKKKHTPPQTSLSKQERLQNLTGVFEVAEQNAKLLQGAHIILLDDVTTTGATLNEAKKTLLPFSPASILCVALTH